MLNKIFFGCIILIIGLILSGILKIQFSNIYISNTDIPLDIITLIAGLVALIIYYTQKKDAKKDAANILYIEITNAEKIMKLAKENLEQNMASEHALSANAMHTESWSKYKYLFVRDFDRIEWDSISDFYSKTKLFDQAVNHNQSLFQKNEDQVRGNLQRILFKLVENNPVDVSKIDSDEKEEKKWQNFVKTSGDSYNQFMKALFPLYFYKPEKPIIDAKLYLNNINLQISENSVGLKLKKIGGIKN